MLLVLAWKDQIDARLSVLTNKRLLPIKERKKQTAAQQRRLL
jgi:hypothetical protein